MAIGTLRSEQAVGLVHEDRVVDGHGKFYMTSVAGALRLVEVACRASMHHVSQYGHVLVAAKN